MKLEITQFKKLFNTIFYTELQVIQQNSAAVKMLSNIRSAVGLCSPHKRAPTNADSNTDGDEFAMRYLAPLSKVLYTVIDYVDSVVTWNYQTFLE